MHQRIARGAGAMLQEALLPMRTRAARALGQASAPSPQKPERSVWRPDRIPHRARALGLAARPKPHRARALGLAARPIPQHGQKKKRLREKYGFVVDFFDRRSVTVRVTANRMPTDEPRQSHYHLPVAPPALHARVDCPPIPIRLCPPIPAVCVPRAVRSDTTGL